MMWLKSSLIRIMYSYKESKMTHLTNKLLCTY